MEIFLYIVFLCISIVLALEDFLVLKVHVVTLILTLAVSLLLNYLKYFEMRSSFSSLELISSMLFHLLVKLVLLFSPVLCLKDIKVLKISTGDRLYLLSLLILLDVYSYLFLLTLSSVIAIFYYLLLPRRKKLRTSKQLKNNNTNQRDIPYITCLVVSSWLILFWQNKIPFISWH